MDEPRYVMLETIREFGLERLIESGELAALQRRHAAYFVTVAERAELKLRGPEQSAWLDRLAREHDNLRAALAWGLAAVGEPGGETALRLGGALTWFWYVRSHLNEGLQWLTRALAAMPGRSALRMKALHSAGWLAHIQRDSVTMRAFCDESLVIARELEDRWTVAWVLHLLGRDAYFDGDSTTAHVLGQRSLEVAEAVGDRWLIARVFHLLGLAAHIAANYPTARGYHERSLALRRTLGDLEGIALSTHFLGLVAYRAGDFPAARARYRDALLGFRELNSPTLVLVMLCEFTGLAAALQQPERAARLAGTCAMVSESSQVLAIPLTDTVLQEGLEQAKRALGAAAFAAAWAEGRALSLEEAVEEALAVGTPPVLAAAPVPPVAAPGPAAGAPRAVGGLTPREAEVLRLIAAGQSTRQIAAALVVSEGTVGRHVTNLYSKIGAQNRAEATAYAFRHQLTSPPTP